MKLTNNEIIDLYHESDFDTIITDLKLDLRWEEIHHINTYRLRIGLYMGYTKEKQRLMYNTIINELTADTENKIIYDSKQTYILSYAISTSNIELFKCAFIANNLCDLILINAFRNPLLYSALEYIFEQNNELCDYIINYTLGCCKLVISYDIILNNNIALLKLIMHYMPNLFDKDLFIGSTICENNLEILDILFELDYNMQYPFDELMKYISCHMKITSDTLFRLEKYGVNILNHIEIIVMLCIYSGDLDGIKYCVANGIDVNYILKTLKSHVDLPIVKYLIESGADIYSLSKYEILFMTKSPDVIIFLIESGLDIQLYAFELLFQIIRNGPFSLFSYIIKLHIDLIHISDDFLLFYASMCGKPKIVQLLLDLGADIHADSDSILLFFESTFLNRTVPDINNLPLYRILLHSKWDTITKILLKNGAITNDVQYVFTNTIYNGFLGEELFNMFLELGVDLNGKNDHKCTYNRLYGKYILELVVSCCPKLFKVFITHGADPFINLHGPLKMAIEWNNSDVILLLLELGSELDPEFECEVEQDTIDVIEKFGISNHKLTMIQ